MVGFGRYVDRDVSWLAFNKRVLEEAARPYVPLLERLNFLGIFSSNLDEFYRVRIPVLRAYKKVVKQKERASMSGKPHVLKRVKQLVRQQQTIFGQILRQQLVPKLAEEGIRLLYDEPIPEELMQEAERYFFSTVAAFLEINDLSQDSGLFPLNNQLYFLAVVEGAENPVILRVPSHAVPRFHAVKQGDVHYVMFIDDIIRQEAPRLFGGKRIAGLYSFKITRDADIPIDDGFGDDMIDRIERQIRKRDYGLATRLLYQPDIPNEWLSRLMEAFSLRKENRTKGGPYHNLKDLMGFPVKLPHLMYPATVRRQFIPAHGRTLHDEVRLRDILISTPYESFDPVLRFFNEAAVDADVLEIKTTIYRVAVDSLMLHALMTAAKNGKKVTVFVELKARFDEENNIKWAKRMREAGVNIIYSIPELKVHAKVALIKKKADKPYFLGLLATGNLNENNAKIYADHFLLTGDQALLTELDRLFEFLHERRKPLEKDLQRLRLKHLFISQFNFKAAYMQLIDTEIGNAKKGLPASIMVKLNNLEEEELIDKLYEASNAGVDVSLIIRGICRLRPGIPGLSERITVRRIVGRYLEHARVFIFHHHGRELVYMGSADWMNRSVYSRIEVCFPVYDDSVKQVVKQIIQFQLEDGASAVLLDAEAANVPVTMPNSMQAQIAISDFLAERRNK